MTDGGDKKFNVLIAEQSPSVRETLVRKLGTVYTVFESANGREAVEILRRHGEKLSLILLDMELPFGGSEVFGAMKRLGYIDRIPVIAILPPGREETAEYACDLGAADFISSEYPQGMFTRRIENITGLFAARRNKAQGVKKENDRRFTDKLTGCLTMEGFRSEAADILHRYPQRQYALWVSDIKNFKLVNNAFGYEAGNELLQYWAGLVLDNLDEDELFGRISGDRFAALTRMRDNKAERKEFDELEKKVGSFFENYRVDICSGIYIIKPNDMELDINYMLDLARIAQRSVKESGAGGKAFFDEEQWNRVWRNMAICNHLDEAIKNGEISIWLQPQYNYITGEIIGAEALSRWNHAELGPIFPGEFIPILEDTGQVYKLDRFVWEQACILMKRWGESDEMLPVSVSVNISRSDLDSFDCCGYLVELLKKYGISPDMLRLEITESSYMKEPQQLAKLSKRFQEMGFTLEMDDFGSGYSSLSMLKEIPVDILKMDLKFLYGSGEESRSGIILSSVLRMAHQLEMPVICEGVETAEQADFMKNLGCRFMQGYYFSKPMTVSDFERLIKNGNISKVPRLNSGAGLRKLNALLNSKSSSAFIFDQCIGGAALMEYHEGVCDIIMVNDSFYGVMGLKHNFNNEVYCVNPLDYITDDSRPDVIEALEKAISQGYAGFEFQFAKNGRWVSGSCRHVAIGEKGNILFVTFENVTQSHEMRSRLIELNDELQAHMKLMPGAVFRYEADGKQEFSYISDSMLDLLGYPSMEAFKTKFHNNFPEMVYKEDRERVLKEIDEQIKHGTYDSCLYRIETADGSLKWVYDKGHIVIGDDGKRYFYVIIVDMGGYSLYGKNE